MNKKDVYRTQPKGCSTAKLEQEMPIIEEGVENVCLKEEKLNVAKQLEAAVNQAFKEVQGE